MTINIQQRILGDIELLELHTKTFSKADFKGAYNSGRTQDEFSNGKKHFVTLAAGGKGEIKFRKVLQKSFLTQQEALYCSIEQQKLD